MQICKSVRARALLFAEVGQEIGQTGLEGQLLELCAQLRSLELPQREGRQFAHWNKVLIFLCAEV